MWLKTSDNRLINSHHVAEFHVRRHDVPLGDKKSYVEWCVEAKFASALDSFSVSRAFESKQEATQKLESIFKSLRENKDSFEMD